MPEINKDALKDNFYKVKAWHKNIVEHYSLTSILLDKDALDKPMEGLTNSIYNVVYINRFWPEDAYNLLNQAIGPLWDPTEYREKIYNSLKSRAVSEKEPRLDSMAESLIFIRKLFERDADFLQNTFSKEISLSENLENFAEKIQKITITHVRQVMRLVEERR